MTMKNYRILLVEDNPGHAELVKRSIQDHPINTQIEHITDGESALNYLFKRGDFAECDQKANPNIILLDLRMPKVDGLEVLKEIRQAEALKSIPVVILTTSESDRDIEMAYNYAVNSYLVKPMDYDEFDAMIQDMITYWFNWNQHPLNLT